MPDTNQSTQPSSTPVEQASPPAPEAKPGNGPKPKAKKAKPDKMFGPRCLMPLLDLKADQTVLFLKHDQTLVRSVQRRGAVALSVVKTEPKAGKSAKGKIHLDSPNAPLPLADASVDHIVLTSVNATWWRPERLAELARVAAPGATLLFGADSRTRFPLRRSARTPGSGRRRLIAAGFTRAQVYGVRHGFYDPRFLVALDSPGARSWFFASAYVPREKHHARTAALLARLPRTPLDQVFFPNVLFTATREQVL
jgi:SAM-dependent methyltransferase